MRSEEGLKEVIKMMIKTLNQMGVTLQGMEVDPEVPVVKIQLDGKRLIQSVNDTLTNAYGILWSLIYGKITNDNRNKKIDLQYVLINEGDVIF